jgi:hypothetical protein
MYDKQGDWDLHQTNIEQKISKMANCLSLSPFFFSEFQKAVDLVFFHESLVWMQLYWQTSSLKISL